MDPDGDPKFNEMFPVSNQAYPKHFTKSGHSFSTMSVTDITPQNQ